MPISRPRRQRHQHIAGMRDRAVGQHALDVGLLSAAKLPIVIESSAEIQTSGSQPRPIGSNAVMKIRRKTANAAAFGPAERNAVTGVGRALVHVRRPDLERRAGNFERQPDEHQRGRQADEQRVAARPAPVSDAADGAQVDASPWSRKSARRRKGRTPSQTSPAGNTSAPLRWRACRRADSPART